MHKEVDSEFMYIETHTVIHHRKNTPFAGENN